MRDQVIDSAGWTGRGWQGHPASAFSDRRAPQTENIDTRTDRQILLQIEGNLGFLMILLSAMFAIIMMTLAGKH